MVTTTGTALECSSLYWDKGFGMPTILINVILGTVTYLSSGMIQGIILSFLILSLIFTFYRYYHWNGSPRNRVNGRAMLLFTHHSGKELYRSKNENRPYDIAKPCYRMAVDMCGNEKILEITDMIRFLSDEKGNYFAYLIKNNAKNVFPTMGNTTIQNYITMTNRIDMCPQLVIAHVLENSYGPIEATKYVFDVMNGKLK